MTEQQAVVENKDAVAQPTAPETSARNDADDLDALLAQYDQEVRPPAPPPEQPPQEVSPDRIARLEQKLFQEEINQTVTSIVGDMKIPHRAALGWLDQMARENPKLTHAFLNKNNDPRTWKRAEKLLREEMRKEFSSLQVDRAATEDREAVAAAVRGASTIVPKEPPPNFGAQSNRQFRKEVMEKYGFDPGV